MCKKLSCLIALVLFLGLTGNTIASTGAFVEVGGMVVMEGEHFHAADIRTDENDYEWFIDNTQSGFVGTGYVTTPTPQNQNGTWDNACEVTYEINFSTSGTYSVWLRRYTSGGGDNSLHVGLDGVANGSTDNTESLTVWNWKPLGTIDVTAGLHTLNLRRREAGYQVDRIVLTTDITYTPTGDGPPESSRGSRGLAYDPNPAPNVNEVLRDSSLSWTPGIYAPDVNGHNVYFGTDFDDVNDGVVPDKLRQDANSYDPGRLDFGVTYFWRIDEVNAPPTDATVFRGNVWSFTVEPYARPVPVEAITATASSYSEGQGPEKTIDRSGMDVNDLHTTIPADMWLSDVSEPNEAWIQYEFDIPYKLHQMLVWNYNGTSVNSLSGCRDVIVEYSLDGTNWTPITSVSQFVQAPGEEGYKANTIVDFNDVPVKYVKINANINWGGSIFIFNKYGLSEVQFLQVPLSARLPVPDVNAMDVAVESTLSWTPGREAASHTITLSTDPNLLVDNTVIDTNDNPYDITDIDLKLGTTYYWRIDEVNEAEIPSVWEGLVWHFTTQSYISLDEFESYTDEWNHIVFQTWIDGIGWEDPNGATGAGNGSGAAVGYWPAPTIEDTNTYDGSKQSMPLTYGLDAKTLSEATYTLPTPLPVNHGITTLSLQFYGKEANVAGQLFVKINGTKVSDYPGAQDDMKVAEWHPWTIDLTGITTINTMTIGVTGGSGMVFIDAIRLYPTAD